jgi:N-acetylglucosamine kinase-like BadF-type ATPase
MMAEMIEDKTKWIVGVDAGGSKTVAWLAQCQSESPQVFAITLVGFALSGPANPGTVGVAGAISSINEAIQMAILNGSTGDDSSAQSTYTVVPASIWVAAAGAARLEISQLLRQGIADKYPSSIVAVSGDVSAMIAAAQAVGRSKEIPNWILRNTSSGSNDGLEFDVDYKRPAFTAATVIECTSDWKQAVIAIIAGTGSVVWATDRQGNEKQWGGQGAKIGDVGSGYWLARQAIRAVKDCECGSAPATDLGSRLLQHFEIVEIRELDRVMLERGDDPGEIARLAPVVLSAAANDPVAAEIVESGLLGLAELARQAAGWLEDESSITWALGGGVLSQNPEIAERLMDRLIGKGVVGKQKPVNSDQPEFTPLCPVKRLSDSMKVVQQPVWGAVLLAANQLVGHQTEGHQTECQPYQ